MDQKLTKDEKKAIRQEETRDKMDRERKNGMYKTVGWWVFGAVLLALSIWALVAFSTGQTTTTSSSIAIPKVTTSDFQSGPATAKVTLVEYADFQCPACKSYFPLVKQLQADFGTKMNFVYRFFPLETVHQNALNSAKAAYAANMQGKFWEMHDKLFTTQDNWATLPSPESTFVSYAKDLGLNTTQFKKDYEAQATQAFVDNAYTQDTSMGLNSTPTFFVNGKQIDNPQSLDDFRKLIENAMK